MHGHMNVKSRMELNLWKSGPNGRVECLKIVVEVAMGEA